MVSAVAPVAPVRPQAFRVAQIAALAYLGYILRHMLVTSTERFRLHLYILGRSFGLATRYLLQATKRIIRNEPDAERQWKNVENSMADIQTLTDKSLESLKTILQSLDREPALEAEASLAGEPRRQPEPRVAMVVALVSVLIVLLLALHVWL